MARLQIRGVCPHDCPDACALITDVEDGRAVAVAGDPTHAITQGWLCAKVRPYLSHVYHADRLLSPLRRVGPKGAGRWTRVSWDDAIAEIAEKWRGIIAEYGPAAIMPYSYSGTLGLVQMVVASGRFWNRLGASRLERTICGAAAEHAMEVTLGGRYAPPYQHLEECRLIIVWGHNPVTTAPHVMPFIRRAQRNGAKLVVIDPRRTRTAHGADLHIAPRPGTDAALALGMARAIVDGDLHDEAWLRAHTVGWPELRARLTDYPVSRVADLTGVDADTIGALAREYATTRPSAIKFSDGLQRRVNGGQTIRALAALPALTAQYGSRGGGLFYSTSSYFAWDAATLQRAHECPPPARSVNMNRLGAALTGEIANPPIKSLFVFGANPAGVSPNAGRIVEGLRREDLFTVVHELFMTDTAAYADLVLPATSQLEQVDLHRGYGHTHVAYNHRAIEPLGEAQSNWDVMQRLATAMGFTEPWLHQTPDAIIDELLTATARTQPAFAGITLERLKHEGPIALSLPVSTPFEDGRFPTPSGKVELYSATLAEQGLDPLPGWTPDDDHGPALAGTTRDRRLRLLTPAAHHFVTSSFANQAALEKLEGQAFVEIHPQDADARGIADGDWVVVENSRGACALRAVVTTAVIPGVLASPKGFWAQRSEAPPLGDTPRNVNWTTSDALADFAGQSTFHTNDVWLRRSNRT